MHKIVITDNLYMSSSTVYCTVNFYCKMRAFQYTVYCSVDFYNQQNKYTYRRFVDILFSGPGY